MKIKNISAQQIFDSRGFPTVEITIQTENGHFTDSCPSGSSTGSAEALELRDQEQEFHGKGIKKALENLNLKVIPAILKQEFFNQREVDDFLIKLDGTKNKSMLGANSILPLSLAFCRAFASEMKLELYEYIKHISKIPLNSYTLPVPALNIINGGQHAGNLIPFQEFMIIPLGARSFEESMKMASEIYHHLKKILQNKFGLQSTNIGDEGGFAPSFNKFSSEINDDTLPIKIIENSIELCLESIDKAGYKGKVKLGIDVAASCFYSNEHDNYDLNYKGNNPVIYDRSKLAEFYNQIYQKYPFVSIEDPFSEEDWQGFQTLISSNKKMIVIGDDLLTTNIERIKKAAKLNCCNGLLLKLNQIGTVSEGIDAALEAKKNGWTIMVSHRSGETLDDFISDLAVGIQAEYIKSGAPCRGERVAKYNRLLKIERKLKKK